VSADVGDLFPEASEIGDADLRDKTVRLLQELIDEGNWASPGDMPFVLDIPASRFDAVQHVHAVVGATVAVAEVVERVLGIAVNRDELLSAALLHDASKWVEYAPDGVNGKPTYSAMGAQLPHASYVAVKAAEAGLPAPVVQAIASHTPQNSFPTSSAMAAILHHVDLAITDSCRLAAGLKPLFKNVRSLY
jgi:hypothetical protein